MTPLLFYSKEHMIFGMAKAKVKTPFLYTIVLHRLFSYFWNVTQPHIYFPKKKMQKLGNIQAPAPNLFSWKCTAWVEKSNIGRQVIFFPLAHWVPHVKRTWHKVGHPPPEAQQQMDWLRMSTAAKIWKCQNRIKHVSWGNGTKNMCENGNLKLEPTLKEVRLKVCVQLLLRTQFTWMF